MRKIVLLVLLVAALVAPAYADRLQDLKATLGINCTEDVNDWKFQFPAQPGGEKVGLDDSSWQTVKLNQDWPGDNTQAWFRKEYVVPEKINGFSIAGKPIVLRAFVDDDGDIYVNGEKKTSFHWDQGQAVITEKAVPGEKILIAIYGKNGPAPGRLCSVKVEPGQHVAVRAILGRYLSDIDRLQLFSRYFGAGFQQTIDNSISLIDIDAAKAADVDKLGASVKAASDALAPLSPQMKTMTTYLVGNAHIDMAWLWRWEETVGVCRDTYRSALKFMDEYPGFKYSQSQAQSYLWMEEREPEIFKAIQQKVKDGQWEIVGGMWVEPDGNLPSGESFVRQVLYGKRYFKEKFGVDVKVGWNPDSFGFNWNLPQIYKKSGIDYFMTTKLGWNDTTRFPYNIFKWRGPDGSEIIGYQTITGYGGGVDEGEVMNGQAFAKSECKVDDVMYLYGVGDHGGGPTRDMLERAKAIQANPLLPNVKWETAIDWFEKIQTQKASFPVWDSELYLQKHRGTYTTQANNKKSNRKSEFALFCAEELGSLAKLQGGSYPDGLLPIWRKVLFNQFHDVLPGSSIGPVYEDSAKDYQEIFSYASKATDDSLSVVADKANTSGLGTAVFIYNPLSWSRSSIVEMPVSGAATILDTTGKEVPTQLVDGGKKIIFIAKDVPAVGYKVFRLVPRKPQKQVVSTLSAKANALENASFRVEIDPATGNVSRIYDKAAKREVLAAQGNVLEIFEDTPRDWDAWDVDGDDMAKPIASAEFVSAKLVENGPVRSTIRVTRKYGKSTMEQDVVLYAGMNRIDFPTRISWHEDHKMLKAAFPFAVKSDYATYEIPYASIKRTTQPKTDAERAMFEVCAQKWADMSEPTYGVSLLNDCKYGYSAKDNVLRLSLLRSPKNPDPNADMGDHNFTYSLMPHKQGWQAAGTVQAGYELNQPLIVRAVKSHDGKLPASYSFLSVSASNVVLGAMKKAEDSDALILRLYESQGKKGSVTVKLPAKPKKVVETNLMEQESGKVKVSGRDFTSSFGPYEIKTFMVSY